VAGAKVSLEGSCSSAAAQLVYLIDGAQAVFATCPEPGSALAVSVRPVLAGSTDCQYNATAAYTLSSESRATQVRHACARFAGAAAPVTR
jgi:hypothetical protein